MDNSMFQPVHILNQLGVLASFSVAKRITDIDIQDYFKSQKKTGKSEREIDQLFREKVLKDIENAVETNKIPGLISHQEIARNMGMDKQVVARIPELNRLILIIVQKMAAKQYDKMSMCYFVNSVVNFLGLKEQDFEKFHEQNSSDNDDDDGDNEFKDA